MYSDFLPTPVYSTLLDYCRTYEQEWLENPAVALDSYQTILTTYGETRLFSISVETCPIDIFWKWNHAWNIIESGFASVVQYYFDNFKQEYPDAPVATKCLSAISMKGYAHLIPDT